MRLSLGIFPLIEEHRRLGRSRPALEGRRPLRELPKRGQRVVDPPGPREEVPQKLLHVIGVVALRVLRHKIGHELPRLTGITPGGQRHARRRRRPHIVDLVEEDGLGAVEIVCTDLGQFLERVGRPTAEQHRAGRLQLRRLVAELHLPDLVDGDLLGFSRTILELHLIGVRRRDTAGERAGGRHHPVGRLRGGLAPGKKDPDEEDGEEPWGGDRSPADGRRHGGGIPGRAGGRHEAATGGASSSASPRGLVSPRSFWICFSKASNWARNESPPRSG